LIELGLKVALLEYICCSGTIEWSPCDPSQRPEWVSLLREGHAMLGALGSDLIREGHSVHTTVEPTIKDWAEGNGFRWTDWHMGASPSDPSKTIDQIAAEWIEVACGCDTAILIAPELDGILPTLVAALRRANLPVLASSDEFLRVATDKWLTGQHLQAMGVRHPTTWLLSDWLNDPPALLPYQGWVVKRRDSAGAVDLNRLETTQHIIDLAGAGSSPWSDTTKWIVQPWVVGQPASVAILAEQDPCALGALEQHLQFFRSEVGAGLTYTGGKGPMPETPAAKLQGFVENVLGAIPGRPRGWLGIDFVIEPDGAWTAIEINARLTSSYLGYRRLYGSALASSLVRGQRPYSELARNARCHFSLAKFHG
jgi:predicted ATP-grasp superfamily ATP-dependent carboligase